MRRRSASSSGGGFSFGRKLRQALARNQRIAAEVSRVLDAARRPEGGDQAAGPCEGEIAAKPRKD